LRFFGVGRRYSYLKTTHGGDHGNGADPSEHDLDVRERSKPTRKGRVVRNAKLKTTKRIKRRTSRNRTRVNGFLLRSVRQPRTCAENDYSEWLTTRIHSV
jgi:hypothetical protein